jgi:CDP-diacylglycerol--serine O-phosphatidyltransferase
MIIIEQERTFVRMDGIETACYLIFIAGLLDFLDGFVARILGLQSEIGKQLDSLADIVTFGVVPGLIMYVLLANSFQVFEGAMRLEVVYFLPGFLITVFAAIRLAKFNIDSSQSNEFKGVPTPAVGLLIASLPLIIRSDATGLSKYLVDYKMLYGIVLILSFLMVSNFRMLGLKFKSLDFGENKWKFLLIILSALTIILSLFVFDWKFLFIPILFALYIVVSIISNFSNNETPVMETDSQQ